MGYGSYSYTDRAIRSSSMGYTTKMTSEIFTEKSMNNAMTPQNAGLRESRDSEDHPNSLAMVLALDVTGSMGSIPHFLVKEGLPNVMDGIIKSGIKDPQLLFLGIGDHTCDRFPLQVGQFESSDALLDKWLTTLYLEGGGGPNDGESYFLAWYFAAKHTSIDCFLKRKVKGFLFTVGDEPCLPSVPKSSMQMIMGESGQYDHLDAAVLLDKARETYNVYHFHMKQGANGTRQGVMDGWKQLMGKNLFIVDRREDVSDLIIKVVTNEVTKTVAKQEDIIL